MDRGVSGLEGAGLHRVPEPLLCARLSPDTRPLLQEQIVEEAGHSACPHELMTPMPRAPTLHTPHVDGTVSGLQDPTDLVLTPTVGKSLEHSEPVPASGSKAGVRPG